MLGRDGLDWRFERDVADAPRYSRSIVSRPGGVGRVYVLTSAGLFVLDRDAGEMRAFRVPGVPGVPGRAWDGLDLGEQLLVATASGVVQLDAAGIRVVAGG